MPNETDADEDRQLRSEFTSKLILREIEPQKVWKHSEEDAGYTPCSNKNDALKHGITGSELWVGGQPRPLLPERTRVTKNNVADLPQIMESCERRARELENIGYPIAAQVMRKRAEWYRAIYEQLMPQ